MRIDKEKIKTILVISLSNIGDVILTTPVIDSLSKEFPQRSIDVIVGPKAEEIFRTSSLVRDTIVYDKFSPLRHKFRLIKKLRSRGYDLVIDLRNCLIPFLIRPRYRTSIKPDKDRSINYMKDTHLNKLKEIGIDTEGADFSIEIRESHKQYANSLLKPLKDEDNLASIAPGAASDNKRWMIEGFIEVARRLIDSFALKIILVGDKDDFNLAKKIEDRFPKKVLNLCGKTSIIELAAVLKNTKFLISNDSAPMHLATAINLPVIAIFGPTNHKKYGPRRKDDYIIRKDLECSPCEAAQCRYNHECLKLIKPDDVIEKVSLLIKKR